MTTIIIAFTLGIIGTISGLAAVAILGEKSKPTTKSNGLNDARKLEIARNRIGQMVSLDSLKVIRKIGHKAMEETE